MELDEFLQLWSINMQIEWKNNKRFQWTIKKIFFLKMSHSTRENKKKIISQ